MIEYKHIIQEIVKAISQFTFEYTFSEVKCKMELREVPKDVLDELGEKKVIENFENQIFYMKLPDGKIIDINSFCNFIKKEDVKYDSNLIFNFRYVRWEFTEDLTTPQIRNYIKKQLTNNNELILSEAKKALVCEELKNKQIDGYLDEIAIKTNSSIEQGKFYFVANCPPEYAYKLINETINELQVEKAKFVEKKLKLDKKYACWYFVFIVIILALWLVINKLVCIPLPKLLFNIISIILFLTPLVIMRLINHSYITRAFCVKKAKRIYEKEFNSQSK